MTNKEEATLGNLAEKLDIIQVTLQDILKWSRFQNLPRLRQVFEQQLDTREKKLAFENTDGEKGYRQVAKGSGVPASTVQYWWNRWHTLGILEPSRTRKGRLKKICSLSDVDIEIPKMSSNKIESGSIRGGQ